MIYLIRGVPGEFLVIKSTANYSQRIASGLSTSRAGLIARDMCCGLA